MCLLHLCRTQLTSHVVVVVVVLNMLWAQVDRVG